MPQTRKGQSKMHKVMSEYKDGSLKSGSGDKVTSRKQAVAIALAEARKADARGKKRSKGKKASPFSYVK